MFTGFVLASILGGLALPFLEREEDEPEEEEDQGLEQEAANRDGSNILTMAEPEAEVLAVHDAPVSDDEDEETQVLQAAPGEIDAPDLGEDGDLVVRVPDNTTAFERLPADADADPPEAPGIRFESPDGQVTVRFQGLSDVPVDRVSIAWGEDEAALSDLLMETIETATVGGAEDAAVPELPSDGADAIMAAIGPVTDPDPEGPPPEPGPPDPADEDGDDLPSIDPVRDPSTVVLDETPRPDPDSGDDVQEMILSSEMIHDDGEPPAIVEGFEQGDILRISTDDPDTVSVRASGDGLGSEILIGSNVVAVVNGSSQLTLDDLEILSSGVA